MDRTVATLPESVDELCLIRLGLIVRKLGAWPFALRIGREIRRSADEAMKDGAGLLASEFFLGGSNHLLVVQYWESFDRLEAWSHRPPHSLWWRKSLERMRTKGDFGIYHETFAVPRGQVESIYLNTPRVGLASFGDLGPAEGKATASRDRLGRRGDR